MKALTINDALRLKEELYKQFDTDLSLHDACGGQYFTSSTLLDGAQRNCIDKFLERLGFEAKYAENGRQFIVV